MTCYLVMHGETGGGGNPLSLHKCRDLAVKEALAVECCFPGGWRPSGGNTWYNGCDFVEVVEMTLEE